MTRFFIGKVSKLTGVSVEAIRYYERLGLLSEPPRKQSLWGHGYRMYQEQDVKQLLFIREAKKLGFTLKEIKELLSLRFDKKTSCKSVRVKAERKLVDVRNRIKALLKIEKSLEILIKACKERKVTDSCPILTALNNGEKS